MTHANGGTAQRHGHAPAGAGGIRITRDVVYGSARVGVSDPARTLERRLCMDVYEPAADDAAALRPALLLAFGGAFHRGTKEDDRVSEGAGSGNTAIAAYCAAFARRGYVSCSIDYRLVQEDPDPGATPVIGDAQRIPRSRVDHVRGLLGLPPVTAQALWQGIEAAADDMAAAFDFLRAQARTWRVDPARIAVGGFSAGARTALNAAYGERVPAAAVVALSGYMDLADLEQHLHGRVNAPAVLLVHGENDLDYVRDHAQAIEQGFTRAGVPCSRHVVPGSGHFYGADAPVAGPTGEARTVEGTMAAFLAQHLQG